MPAKKGVTNNPNGRPSDPNVKKLREALRSNLVNVVRIKKLFDALDDLNGKEYIDYFLRIQKDIMPSLAPEQTTEEIETKKDLAAVMEMVHRKLSETG